MPSGNQVYTKEKSLQNLDFTTITYEVEGLIDLLSEALLKPYGGMDGTVMSNFITFHLTSESQQIIDNQRLILSVSIMNCLMLSQFLGVVLGAISNAY